MVGAGRSRRARPGHQRVRRVSPWLAQKLVRWAARVRYPTRVEELSALIAERPGKLFKLVTAAGFACAALAYRVTHRKTAPVHSVTSRLWIGLGSALAAWVLLTGEILLGGVITGYMIPLLLLIALGVIAVLITAAELLVSTRLPAGWATAVVSFAPFLIYKVVLGCDLSVGELLPLGGLSVAASVSAACAIRLGSRLRLPVMAASSTILGSGLLACTVIWNTSTGTSDAIWMLIALGAGLKTATCIPVAAGAGGRGAVSSWIVGAGTWLPGLPGHRTGRRPARACGRSHPC